LTQISKGSEGYQIQCKACVWQDKVKRGRLVFSYSTGRFAPELLQTFSINVISNKYNADLIVTTESTTVVAVRKHQHWDICCEDWIISCNM